MSKSKSKQSNLKNGVCWSTRFIANSVMTTLFTSYFSFYATDVLGLSVTMVGVMLLITKLFDGVTDLAAGFLIDNTHTRWGKARPYDWVIPLTAIGAWLTFAAPSFSQTGQLWYLGIMYVLTFAVFGTLLGASENVYLLRAFPEESERNSVFTIGMIIGQISSLAVGIVVPLFVADAGTSAPAWSRMVFLLLVPISAVAMIRFFTIKEKVTDTEVGEDGKEIHKEKVGLKDGVVAIVKNKYIIILTLAMVAIMMAAGILNTSAAYYFTYFVGDVKKMSVIAIASFASLLMIFFFNPLAEKFGKVKVVKAALIFALIGCIIRWIGGANIITIGLGIGMMMFGIMPISVFFPLLLFDIMDFGEWKTGVRVEGVLSVFPNFAMKIAGGLSVSLGAFVLGAGGYDGSLAVQPESAYKAIDFCFNGIPTIFLGVMVVILLLFYDIDKILPKVRQELEVKKEKHVQKIED